MSDVLQLFGAALVVAGVTWVFPPAGLVVAGLMLFVVGFLAEGS